MSDIPNLSGKVGLDVTDFKSGITELNREIRVIESGFQAAAAGMGDWGKSASGLETRIKALSSEIELQQKKVEAVRGEYERVRKEKGDNSRAAQELQIKINKENETLGKLQTELGHTETRLNGLKTTTGGVKGAFKDMGTQLDKLKQQVPALGTAFSLLTNPLSLSVAGIGAFAKFASDATKKTLEYNKQVMEMGQLTGLSAEETSRIIQVADDWEIEIGTVSKAMELMNKKGITPSIDNLADLADQYVAATDKSIFMEEATKKYGKSVGDLIPMLAKGGDALREQAAAVNDNMLATDESIKSSREFKVASDNLNDTLLGIGYTVGNQVIPPLTDFFNLINDQLSGEAKLNNLLEIYNMLIDQGYIKGKKLYAQTAGASLGVKGLSNTLNVLTIILDEYNDVLKYSGAIEKEEAIRRGKLNDVTEDSAAAQLLYNDAVEDYVKRSPLFLQQYANFIKSQEDAERAIYNAELVFDNFKASLGGAVDKELADFNQKQAETTQELQDTQAEIDKLNGMDYLTDDQKTELADLKQKQLDLQTEYGNNAVEHQKATRKILIDIAIEKLASADLTKAQKKAGEDMIRALAEKWGLTNQLTLDAYNAADGYIAGLTGGDLARAKAALEGNLGQWALLRQASRNTADATWDYNDALNTIDGKTVDTTIITHHYDSWDPGAGHDFGAAEGMNAIVPPGYPNDSFNLGLTSGERVIVFPKFKDNLAAIQQIAIQAINGLNLPGGMGSGGGAGPGYGRQMQPAVAPISITIQGAPSNEMNMRRLARYVATEIQRGQR